MKFTKQLLIAVGMLAGVPGICSAGLLTDGDVVQLRRYSSGTHETFGAASGGGEFALFKKLGDGSYEYLAKTFCIEYDEHITLNTDFLVGGVSDRAVLGGSNTNFGDPIGYAVDFLYSAFATGTLDTFDLGSGIHYSATSDIWANALQRAIWMLEEEVTGFGSYSYSDEAELLHDFALSSVSTWTENTGNVKALNLFAMGTNLTGFDALNPTTYNSDGRWGKHKQDQLWYIPDAAGPPDGVGGSMSTVPEPHSVLIWSAFGIAGVFARRRSKQRQV